MLHQNPLRSTAPPAPFAIDNKKDAQEPADARLNALLKFDALLASNDEVFLNAEDRARRDKKREVIPAEELARLKANVERRMIEYAAEEASFSPEELNAWWNMFKWSRVVTTEELIYVFTSESTDDVLWAVELWLASLVVAGETDLFIVQDTTENNAEELGAALAGWLPMLLIVEANPKYAFGTDNYVAFTRGVMRGASKNAYLDVLQWLVATLGIDYVKNIAFREAARHGQLSVLKWITAQSNVSVDALNAAFLLATKNGHLRVLQWLAAQPGDVTARKNQAVIEAAKNGHLHVVQWLAAQPGVDVTARNNQPVRSAAQNGHLEVVQWLATKPGVDITANKNYVVRVAAENGHLNVVQWLAAQPGVDVTAKDNHAVRWAAGKGHLHVVQWLATQPGVDVTADKNYAVRWAANGGHLNVLQWIAAQPGVDVTANNNEAFFRAVFYGHLHIVQWLVMQPNVDFATFANEGFHTSVEQKHLHIVEWFASINMLPIDILLANTPTTTFLLDAIKTFPDAMETTYAVQIINFVGKEASGTEIVKYLLRPEGPWMRFIEEFPDRLAQLVAWSRLSKSNTMHADVRNIVAEVLTDVTLSFAAISASDNDDDNDDDDETNTQTAKRAKRSLARLNAMLQQQHLE